MCRNQPHGYVGFRFWVVWLIAWFDYFTLEIVRREASKVWIRYNGGKPGSYSTMHASVCESEMWNNILSTRSSSSCHLQKVVYLRCSCLVLSASSCLSICASWFGLVRLWVVYEWSVMPTWSVIVIKRVEFDRWLHVISTSGMIHWHNTVTTTYLQYSSCQQDLDSIYSLCTQFSSSPLEADLDHSCRTPLNSPLCWCSFPQFHSGGQWGDHSHLERKN